MPPPLDVGGGSAGSVADAYDVLRWHDVRAYGALGDGVADDRAAIQAAIDACASGGGGVAYVPPGTYRLTETGTLGFCLRLPGRVRLAGCGVASRLAAAAADATTVLVQSAEGSFATAADGWAIEHVAFNPLVDRAADAYEVRVPYSRYGTVDDVYFGRTGGLTTGGTPAVESKVWGFLHLGDASLESACLRITRVRGFGYTRALEVHRLVSASVHDWLSDANNVVAEPIRIYGQCESLMIQRCDWVNSGGGIAGGSAPCCILTAEAGGVPRFNTFTDVFFDTQNVALRVNDGESLTFAGCWFVAATGTGGLGVDVPASAGAVDGLCFTGCRFVCTGAEGARLSKGIGHRLNACEFAGNAKTTSGACLRIGPAAVAAVLGCVFSNTLYSARFGSGSATLSVAVEPGGACIALGNDLGGLPTEGTVTTTGNLP